MHNLKHWPHFSFECQNRPYSALSFSRSCDVLTLLSAPLTILFPELRNVWMILSKMCCTLPRICLSLHTCQGSPLNTLAAGEYAYSVFKELVAGACYACGIRTTHRSIAPCAIRPINRMYQNTGFSGNTTLQLLFWT